MRLTSAKMQDDQGLIPGREGQARLRYGIDPALADAKTASWQWARAEEDYSIQFRIGGPLQGKRILR